MPSSIRSMMSPMRSVSRAAFASASVGVSSAPLSRWRGSAAWTPWPIASGNHFSTRRAMASVKKMKPRASTTLKITWKCSTCRRGSGSSWAMPCSASGSASEKTTQPATLKKRLPSATRRPPPGVPMVATSPMRPLPRLAPSTRHIATGTAITCAAASVAASSTTARLDHEKTREHRADQHVEHRVAGERAEEHLGARGGDDGPGRLLDELQREDDQSQADGHAAELAGPAVPARRGRRPRRRRSPPARARRGPARTPAP